MTTTLVSQGEFDRIKAALFHAGELVALESIAGGVTLPMHILAILHRLPGIVAKIHQLIADIELAATQFFDTERKVLGHFTDSRIGVMEVLAAAASPVARLALGADRVWVRRSSWSAATDPATDTTSLIDRLAVLATSKSPTLRIDSYREAGGRRLVVYVPGTRHFLGGPLDMRTNVLELAGQRSPVERAVELALSEVGAGPEDKVTVVGHSLGGMVAVSLASRSAKLQVPYTVDEVIEIGAPLGAHGPIAGLKLLSIDGSGDLVPKLDGLGKPHWHGATTVSVNESGLHPVKNHVLETYSSDLRKMAEHDGSSQSWQKLGQIKASEGSASFFEFGVSEVPWQTASGR